MKRERARLTNFASRMKPTSETGTETGKPEIRNTHFGNTNNVNPNPPHGEKGDFRKVTVTLPPPVYEVLVRECARRKIAGEQNHLLASLIREAVTSHFKVSDK